MQSVYKVTRARNVGWNNSFEIEEIEISNLDSTALSKLTGYSFKNLHSDLFHYQKEKLVLMRAVNRMQSIENKSASGKIACPVGIPVSLQDVGIPLFSRGLEIIHKDLWDF